MMKRREFIRAGAGLSLLAARAARAGCPKPPPAWNLNRRDPALADLTAGRPPNILLVLTDQERWPGNLPADLARPNLDRLREHSAAFDNTFCAYPLCSPSRAAIFSGLYPHQNGVTHNLGIWDGKRALSRRAPHLGSVLAAAGYRVGYKGKWDLSRGPRTWRDNRDRGRAGDYGFEGHCGQVPDQEFGCAADEQVVAESCDWIRAQRRGQPWFLCCSIINPHDICHPGLKPDRSVRPDVALPASLRDDLSTKPADQLRRRKMRDQGIPIKPKSGNQYRSSEEYWKLFLSFYYDLIEGTDRLLGRVLGVLEDSGLREDTIVVYTSDHGEMGGAHGCHGKYELYEEAAHVPLYIHHPALPRRAVGSLEGNVSLAPTLAALAGADWPGPTAGHDLCPLVTGSNPGRDATFLEHQTWVDYGVYRDINAARAIRTRRWKLVYSVYEHDGELYDLENDPAEMFNLYHEPSQANLRRELMDRLRAWQAETGDRKKIKSITD